MSINPDNEGTIVSSDYRGTVEFTVDRQELAENAREFQQDALDKGLRPGQISDDLAPDIKAAFSSLNLESESKSIFEVVYPKPRLFPIEPDLTAIFPEVVIYDPVARDPVEVIRVHRRLDQK